MGERTMVDEMDGLVLLVHDSIYNCALVGLCETQGLIYYKVVV